ncbi:efflux RND transporter periplasmic adaptor subunit [Roseovarius sp. 217]|uniref:efflux RND transporter periplasmic adaptor subunit n=1 Tax=Roseovarius sp. (strain 217) TaxID=314264 RepID=UPI000068494E|nr:efflux RND transporter periplasmic adaptor subunit [Roseovarius sp. 217]EAQ25936.1 hypothetical protein ROS217_06304 [Roseovarius sp. 217]
MKPRNNHWAFAGASLAIVVSLAAGTALMDFPATKSAIAAETQAEAPAVPVTVAEVTSKKVALWENFSGRLEAVDRVQIRSRVSGTIQSVDFREGSYVKAGDLLFTIDPEPFETAVTRHDGQVALAKAQLDLAQLELDRGAKLIKNRTIPQSVLDQRQNTVLQAQANLRTATAALRSANLELGYTQVRAPISGRVGKIEITAGNLIAGGATSLTLTTLVSVDPIYASFNADEDLISELLAKLPRGVGTMPPLDLVPVEIETGNVSGNPVKGRLQLIDNEVDAASGTIAVRAVFDNPDGLLFPGQFVRVRMGEPLLEDKILVSERAIGTDQDKKFVYVVDVDNRVNYRAVELGRNAEGQKIVEQGLTPGERIVVNGLQRIRPGALVDPQAQEKIASVN